MWFRGVHFSINWCSGALKHGSVTRRCSELSLLAVCFIQLGIGMMWFDMYKPVLFQDSFKSTSVQKKKLVSQLCRRHLWSALSSRFGYSQAGGHITNHQSNWLEKITSCLSEGRTIINSIWKELLYHRDERYIGKTGCGQIYGPVVSVCGLCQPVSEREILAYGVSRW